MECMLPSTIVDNDLPRACCRASHRTLGIRVDKVLESGWTIAMELSLTKSIRFFFVTRNEYPVSPLNIEH